MNDFFRLLLAGLHQMTPLELIAAAFGAISVIYQKKNNILVYPTGLVSTGIYAYLLSRDHFRLYADATLNAYYFIMSIYGWIYWAKKGPSSEVVPITKSSSRDLGMALLISLLGWFIFYYLLTHFSDSNVPVMDAFVSATACAGMWLLAKRKLETWIFLNISNLAAIPLLFYKTLYPTALLTIYLFIVAVFGYFSWKKQVLQREISQ